MTLIENYKSLKIKRMNLKKYEALRDADSRYQNSWHKFTKRKKSKRLKDAEHGADEKKKSHHKQIHGPYRLMRLLPHARPVISRLLEVDPKEQLWKKF